MNETHIAIQLRKFSRLDFEKLISWAENEELLMQFAGPLFTFPLTIQQLESYIKDENRYAYAVIDHHTGEHIGHGEIYLPVPSKSVLCRIIIGDKNLRGKGIGREIINQLLILSFHELGVTSVELNVFDWNIGAIKCYEHTGFAINAGKERARLVNGKTWKVLNMSIERSNWLGKMHHVQ